MSRPTFRIIENSSDFDYEAFKEDYMNPHMPKQEILKKYNITNNRYLRYGKDVYNETGFKRRKGANSVTGFTNIRKVDCGYRIDKTIDGRRIYGGTYQTLELAREMRDKFIESNWDEDIIEKAIIEHGNYYFGRSRKDITHLYPKFEELFFSDTHNYEMILEELGITKWYYTLLLEMLRDKLGFNIRKRCIKV